MKEEIARSAETSIKTLSFHHNRIWLTFMPHGDPVEALGPQLDDHIGLPFKIIEWSKKFLIFIHSYCTTCDKNVVKLARKTLKFSGNMP